MSTLSSSARAVAAAAACVSIALATAMPVSGAASAAVPVGGDSRPEQVLSPAPLDLGAPGLPEKRTVERLSPGVILTRIVRGDNDPVSWVVEFNIPPGPKSLEPEGSARSIQDYDAAAAQAAKLSATGATARVEAVRQVGAVDVADQVLGYRVRLQTSFDTKAEADAALADLTPNGFTGRSWYSGWDGMSAAKGPWTVDVITIDPKSFTGALAATHGADIVRRETTSALTESAGAIAGVNAGFFVFDPTAGAEGDPAGIGVYSGRVLSENVGERPALVFDASGKGSAVARPVWRGSLKTSSGRVALDGLNRVPGLIRNCGGTGDTPTDQAVHDMTCTDADELVLFTSEFGASTPKGAGAEIVVDDSGKVVSIAATRGVALKAGQQSVQATGDLAGVLGTVKPGEKVRLDSAVSVDGAPLKLGKGTHVVNGGPLLVKNGRIEITQNADGMWRPFDASFAYGWVQQRNPRTFAGIDARGRTHLVTVAGRQVGHLGLSIPETARLAKGLGLRDALNLDGGGSTATVAKGRLLTSVSDAAGERGVGDAIVVVPKR